MKIKDKGKYWDKAWQLVDGCTPVSAGCDNCWSAAMTHRFKQGLTDDKGVFTGEIIIREGRLDLPLKTKKPTVWAVWNDLFHLSVPANIITESFDIMQACHGNPTLTNAGYKTYPSHTFLILTKRPERIKPVLFGEEGIYYLGGGDYLQNVWLGTSIEKQEQADKRIPALIKGAGEFKKFLSIEPMLGEIDLSKIPCPNLPHAEYCAECCHDYDEQRWGTINALDYIQQVICGGETGRNARPCHPDWVRSIRDQCQEAGVSFFFKGCWYCKDDYINSKCRILDGRTHDDLVWREEEKR